jgi:hypothetical protein
MPGSGRLMTFALCAVLGCSGSTDPAHFVGSVADPAGDAAANAAQTPAPDIVRGTVFVHDVEVAFTMEFAPGTLKTSTTHASFVVDIDDDVNTGDHHAGNDMLGIDYTIELGAGLAGGVRVHRFTGTEYVLVPVSAALMVGTSTLSVTLTLTVFGGDDGRMAFKGNASALISGGTYTTALDWIPEPGSQPGLAR